MFLAGPIDHPFGSPLRQLTLDPNCVTFGPYGQHRTTPLERFPELLASIPEKEKIDWMLFLNPEYNLIPKGIEEAPFPVVAVTGDWSLNLEAVLQAAPFFSSIIVDYPGSLIFKKFGVEHLTYSPLYGYDPEVHRKLPNLGKVYDISMSANLNEAIYNERMVYLKRLAMMGGKYRIRFSSGLTKPEYVQLINESKIAFNRSVRGEMNLRAYETLACGSLLFIEDENEEAKLYLKDRVDCVFYNEENLESLVDYYLSHDEEREAIAARGFSIGQRFTYENQYRGILEKARPLRKPPEAASWSAEDKASRLIFHAFHSGQPTRFDYIAELLPALHEEPAASFLRGFHALERSLTQSEQATEAVSWLEKSVRTAPDWASAHFNLGEAYHRSGNPAAGDKSLDMALKLACDAETSRPFSSLLFPVSNDRWRLDKEAALRKGTLRLSEMIQFRCLDAQGYFWAAQGNADKAIECYRKAGMFGWNLGSLYERIGRMAKEMTHLSDAARWYEMALKERPFLLSVWKELPPLYLELKAFDRLQRFSDETLKVVDAFPHLSELREEFESWLSILG